MIYVLLASWLIPLGPGITEVNPAFTERGSMTSVQIIGYNTHFDKENPPAVIIKNQNNLICANMVDVISPAELNVEFGLPQDLYTERKMDSYSIIVQGEQDGTFFLRSGISVGRNDTLKGIKLQCTTNIDSEALPMGTTFPFREILYETIRNLFFHVPMWFTMILVMLFSFGSSIHFLSTGNFKHEVFAAEAAKVGILFGVLGYLTGMQWAKMTWGAPIVNDPKLNGAAVGMLTYLAYFVLRGSLKDELARAKISAVYNVFAFVIFIVFIFVIPRITDSLHPGSGGNPGFNQYDLDNTMRPVFYASVFGFTLIAFWTVSLLVRTRLVEIESDKLEL